MPELASLSRKIQRTMVMVRNITGTARRCANAGRRDNGMGISLLADGPVTPSRNSVYVKPY
jgi:hypothetical protein